MSKGKIHSIIKDKHQAEAFISVYSEYKSGMNGMSSSLLDNSDPEIDFPDDLQIIDESCVTLNKSFEDMEISREGDNPENNERSHSLSPSLQSESNHDTVVTDSDDDLDDDYIDDEDDYRLMEPVCLSGNEELNVPSNSNFIFFN